MAWKLTIATVDHTPYVKQSSLRRSSLLNARAVSRFRLLSGVNIDRFMDVVEYADDGVTPVFGGLVMQRSIRNYEPGSGEFYTDITAADYSTYFDWFYLNLSYATPVTLEDVIDDIIASAPAAFGLTKDGAQVTGPTLSAFSWVDKRASDAIRELTDRTGYVGRTSPTKAFKMFVPGTDAAPFAITEASPHVSDFQWDDSDKTPVTRVILKCGPSGLQLTTQYWTQVASETSWTTDLQSSGNLPYGLLWIGVTGDPSDSIAYLVADSSFGLDYFWDPVTHTVTKNTGPTPSPGQVLRLEYNALFPFTIISDSGASPPIEQRFTSPDTTDPSQGQEIADGLRAQLNQSPRTATLPTDDLGWIEGQLVTVSMSTHYVTGSFVITGVDASLEENKWRLVIRILESTTYQGSFLDDWRRLTSAGSGATAISGISGGVTVSSAFSPVFLGGSREMSAEVASPAAWKPVPSYVPYVAGSSFGGRVRVTLFALEGGVTVTARLYNVTDSTVAGTSSGVASTTPVNTSFVVSIEAGKEYRLEVHNGTAGKEAYAIGTLESV